MEYAHRTLYVPAIKADLTLDEVRCFGHEHADIPPGVPAYETENAAIMAKRSARSYIYSLNVEGNYLLLGSQETVAMLHELHPTRRNDMRNKLERIIQAHDIDVLLLGNEAAVIVKPQAIREMREQAA